MSILDEPRSQKKEEKNPFLARSLRRMDEKKKMKKISFTWLLVGIKSLEAVPSLSRTLRLTNRRERRRYVSGRERRVRGGGRERVDFTPSYKRPDPDFTLFEPEHSGEERGRSV